MRISVRYDFVAAQTFPSTLTYIIVIFNCYFQPATRMQINSCIEAHNYWLQHINALDSRQDMIYMLITAVPFNFTPVQRSKSDIEFVSRRYPVALVLSISTLFTSTTTDCLINSRLSLILDCSFFDFITDMIFKY